MKTRDSLYAKEAQELVRTISLYKTLTGEQLYRMFPGKEAVIQSLLSSLMKQGRIFYNQDTGRISITEECDSHVDFGMIAAFWVLLDFLPKAEFHSASDFPVKISFFCDGEGYDIVHIPTGEELLIAHALDNKSESRLLVLVEEERQIEKLQIQGVAAFCTVSASGKISYYKLE